MTQQTENLKRFLGGWGSLINGLLIVLVGFAVLWADSRYTPREEMEVQVKYVRSSIDSLRAEIRDQRERDLAMVERQLRDVQMGMSARQQDHANLHRIVVRLETIVERMENPTDRR